MIDATILRVREGQYCEEKTGVTIYHWVTTGSKSVGVMFGGLLIAVTIDNKNLVVRRRGQHLSGVKDVVTNL